MAKLIDLAAQLRLELGLTDEQISNLFERLSPVLIVDAIRADPEDLSRTDRIIGGLAQVSAAAQVPEAMVYNPIGSNILVIIEKIRIVCTGAINLQYRFFRGATVPGGFAQTIAGPLDTRDPTVMNSTSRKGQMFIATNAASSGGFSFELLPTQANVPLPDDNDPKIVLAPGTGLVIGPTAVATVTLYVSVRWRERSFIGIFD